MKLNTQIALSTLLVGSMALPTGHTSGVGASDEPSSQQPTIVLPDNAAGPDDTSDPTLVARGILDGLTGAAGGAGGAGGAGAGGAGAGGASGAGGAGGLGGLGDLAGMGSQLMQMIQPLMSLLGPLMGGL